MKQIFLAIDASTYNGSAALIGSDGSIIRESEVVMRGAHQERLMPAVAALFTEASVAPHDLQAVVCGEGPGSFTSLRIAASIAKGISIGLGIPLYAISSLLLIPASSRSALAPGRYMAMLDAMRGDFFVLDCVVNEDGKVLRNNSAEMEMLPLAEIERSIASQIPAPVRIGPGQQLDVSPHARGAARFMIDLSAAGISPVDASTWEPHYGRLAEAEVRLASASAPKGG